MAKVTEKESSQTNSSKVEKSNIKSGGTVKKLATVKEVPESNNSSNNNKPRILIKKSRSTLPRGLAGQLRRNIDQAPIKSQHHKTQNDNNSQKGCQFRIGSSFKAIIYLILIIGLTTGVAVWLYHNKFRPSYRTKFGPKSGPETDAKVVALNKTIKNDEPDLYLDFQGNIHRVSEIKVKLRAELGPNAEEDEAKSGPQVEEKERENAAKAGKGGSHNTNITREEEEEGVEVQRPRRKIKGRRRQNKDLEDGPFLVDIKDPWWSVPPPNLQG